MIFRARTEFLLFLALLTVACALHLDGQPNSELQALKQKQQYIKDQVETLNTYASNINSQLRNATTDQQRVQILETALTDERQSIFELKNKIIYPLNESETACKQLSDQQKTLYLKKINQTRTQLNKLQQINLKLNQSSPQIKSVADDIQKQFIELENMEAIINITCNENLTPTIFQSNLKAKNWILGPQTMNDLKEQYAQRALIFHNITNCPLDTPFFDPNSETCIKCQEPNPLFNMFDKECTRCKNQEEYDPQKKVCRSKPHYTNFTRVKNWNLDGGSLPQVDKNLTPCPDDKPYFNGVICVPCDLPLYWSVSANLCKKCDKGQAFDLNTQQCQKIVKYELTILQNTKWVSQNLTKVIEERTRILQKNKTTGNYHYCPQKLSPYYDGTTCVPCDYFDIDQLRCVQKPNGTEYDDNMKRFLSPESNKETNPNAMRYISSTKLSDTSTQNCNSSYPYFDGIACIQCLKPFDIFNVDQRKCVACDPQQTYLESSHKCEPRQKIRISQNFDRLMATPKVTVPEYKQFLIRTINDNPDAIIYPCQDKSHYSNFSDCFPCDSGQYFNVEKLRCQGCDGVYYDSNQTCRAKVYIFTNLKAPNIVDMGQTTIDQENQRISEFLKSHEGSYICPIDKPYAIQNKTCGTCPNLFSYSELVCKQCSEWNIYNPDTRKCEQAVMLVNFTDVHRVLVSDEETLVSFKQQQQKARNQNPNNWKICPGDRPFTKDRQSCFNCTGDSPYFNYTLKQCQACPDHYVFDPVTVRCTQQFFITLINSDTLPKMLGYDNYTLSNFKADQQAKKRGHPTVLCTASEPFGTVTGCQQCNQPTPYFDMREKRCSQAKYLINFQKISPEYLLPSDKNLDFYISEEQRFRRQATVLTKKCPDTTPYTNDRTYCFNCSEGEYFNLGSRKCERCPQGQAYMRDLKTCKQLFYLTKITPVTQPNMKGYSDYSLDDYKRDQANIKANNPFQQCPDGAPYGTTSGCQQCQEPTPYFDIKKRICSSAKKLINFSNIGNNYILADGRNLSSYQENQKNFKLYSESLTVDCPASTPFTSDRQSCFVCKDPQNIFNFQTKRCQSCPRGAEFSVDKKKCLRLFYITNFNDQSQRKMVPANDYSISDYRADQQKLRRQNPYKDCNATEPYGTLDGCKKCTVPEEYFDIKNRVCTAVKRLINFDAVGSNYILREGRSLDDYRREQQAYGSSSDLPSVVCPAATPFTSNRADCFACATPNLYFNFETKACQSCGNNEAYDSNLKRCVLKQYYTLLTSTTERTLLESDNYTVSQYKEDQNKIKAQIGSSECPSTKPYATDNGCISCDIANPYFNIRSKTCQACDTGKIYFEANHQCLLPAYLTDFSNPNIKESANFTVDDARKLQNDRASKPGYTAVKCTGSKPFATLDGCVACNDAKAPYFNIQTLTCEGCLDFYQYFKDRRCNDYVALTNTQEMIGYFEVDNYTKYNVEKMNNFTYISSPDTTKFCPANSPFLNIENRCVACNSSSAPIFNLKEKVCVNVQSLPLSNPQYMKFYIETGDATMAALKKEIDVLKSKGVNVQLCPQDKPYLSHNQCIVCPTTAKYFDLATEVCKPCSAGDNCISA